jgi:Protein of unknown function (DUF551)
MKIHEWHGDGERDLTLDRKLEKSHTIYQIGWDDEQDLPEIICWPNAIPVTERLPDDISYVLVFGHNPLDGEGWHEWYRGFCLDGQWFISHEGEDDGGDIEMDAVTHWLPMPPNPE